MAKVKIELQEAINAFGALQSVSNSSRLGWELAWEIDDLVEGLEKHQKRFTEEGDKILKLMGEPLEDQPGRFTIPEEKREEYQEAMKKLSESKVTIDIKPMKFDDLVKSGIKVQGREMRALKDHFISRTEKEAAPVDKKKLKEELDPKLEKA